MLQHCPFIQRTWEQMALSQDFTKTLMALCQPLGHHLHRKQILLDCQWWLPITHLDMTSSSCLHFPFLPRTVITFWEILCRKHKMKTRPDQSKHCVNYDLTDKYPHSKFISNQSNTFEWEWCGFPFTHLISQVKSLQQLHQSNYMKGSHF